MSAYEVRAKLVPGRQVYLVERGGQKAVAKKASQQEIRNLRKFFHPQIVQPLGTGEVIKKGKKLKGQYLIMQYVEGQALGDVEEPTTLDQAMQYATSITQILAVLAGQGMCHGDLSTGNIITTGKECIAIDLEHAAKFNKHGTTLAQALTYDFVSPETLCLGVLVKNSEVYSLGAILHDSLTHTERDVQSRIPQTSSGVYEDILCMAEECPQWVMEEFNVLTSADARIPQVQAHPRFQKLLEAMLEVDFRQRPSLEDVRLEIRNL